MVFFIISLIPISEAFCFTNKVSALDDKLKREMINIDTYQDGCPLTLEHILL